MALSTDQFAQALRPGLNTIFGTGEVRYESHERYGVGWTNWRATSEINAGFGRTANNGISGFLNAGRSVKERIEEPKYRPSIEKPKTFVQLLFNLPAEREGGYMPKCLINRPGEDQLTSYRRFRSVTFSGTWRSAFGWLGMLLIFLMFFLTVILLVIPSAG